MKTWLATVPIHEADYRIKSIDRGPLNRFDHPATVLDTLFAALVLGPNSNQADQALLDAVVGLWPIWDELGITHAEWEDELTAFIKRLDMNNGSPKEAKAIQYIHELFEQRTEAGYRSRNAHGN
ncbi:MAG: hypothetical protein JNJ83_10070 [Verrucomicrobiaceae bacterium]|nr:hypothetical protein [Verrucomicrobiaceae bacterium]